MSVILLLNVYLCRCFVFIFSHIIIIFDVFFVFFHIIPNALILCQYPLFYVYIRVYVLFSLKGPQRGIACYCCMFVCLSSNMIRMFSFIYLHMNRVSFKCWSVCVFIRVMFCVVLVSYCNVSYDCISLSFVYLSLLFDIIHVIQCVRSFYLDENHFLYL